jgi:hypothetical protein
MGYGSKLVPGACRVFQLAVEEEGGIGEFFSREAEGSAKEDLGRPASGEGHPGPCLFGGNGRWPGVREPFG